MMLLNHLPLLDGACVGVNGHAHLHLAAGVVPVGDEVVLLVDLRQRLIDGGRGGNLQTLQGCNQLCRDTGDDGRRTSGNDGVDGDKQNHCRQLRIWFGNRADRQHRKLYPRGKPGIQAAQTIRQTNGTSLWKRRMRFGKTSKAMRACIK